MKHMIKKLLIFLPFLLAIVLFSSCEKEDPVPVDPDKPTTGEPNPSDPENPTPSNPTNKTILVYILGNNSLQSFIQSDINEMIEGMQNSPNTGNLILYIDDPTASRLVRIRKDEKGEYKEVILQNLGDRNSASYEMFSSVIKKVFDYYPAEKYGLFMWSHGDGWLPSPSNSSQTRWYGQDGNNYMDISEIKRALQEVPHLDFIYFDDCFMQSVEVAYELRHYTDYTIGSVAETPGAGAPYHKLMDLVFQDKADVKTIIERYHNYYPSEEARIKDNWPYGAAISAIRCSELEGLAAATKVITNKYADVLKAISPSTVQNYDPRKSQRAYYDFNDVVSKVANAEDLAVWRQQLDKAVPYKETTSRIYSIYIPGTFAVNENYSGISVYLPLSSYTTWNNFYKTFEWGEASGWNALIN